MKPTLPAAILACMFSTLAQAQSSVTLYGSLDTGVSYTNDASTHNWGAGGHDVRLGSGLTQTDTIGLQGAEDLGNGMKMVYDLEGSTSNGTGTQRPGDARNRVGYVGLSGLP